MKTLALFAAFVGATSPAWAVPVSISVVGPDDKPLAGAQLELRQSDGSAILSKGQTQAVTAPVAAKEGAFSFDWDGPFLAPDAPIEKQIEAPKLLWARISAPGMATQTRRIIAPATAVHLTPGRSWSGAIFDQSEKPVAGVRVRLDSWTLGEELADLLENKNGGSFSAVDKSWAIEAITDAQGRWQFDNLPQRGTAIVQLEKTPYARASYSLRLQDAVAPPLFLKPGAAIQGQILLPDGKPLVGQKVVAGWSGNADDETQTDAQGHFRIAGLEAGQTYLSARSPRDYIGREKEVDKGYLLPQQNMIAVRAGETTDIGSWKAQTGVLLQMRAVDAATGKPIEGAEFHSLMSGARVTSDAKGQMQTRVLRDDSPYPFAGTVTYEKYIRYQVPQITKAQSNGAVNLGDIKLERGSVVSGRVRVEGEEKTSDLPAISLQMGGDSEQINFRNGKSDFETSAIKPGNYLVVAINMNGNESKDWELVSPKNLTVPAPNVAAKPVEIVLKRLGAAALAALQTVSGRIVDAEGKGVAGALIQGQFRKGYSSSGAQAVTDAQGNWRVQTGWGATEFKFIDVERPGYLKTGAAKIAVEGGVAVVTGVSLKRRGAPFSGRVINADGNAARGAWLALPEARYYAPVQADERGQFELTDLPLEHFTLLAGQGANWARVETDADEKNIEIKLNAPAAYNRDAAIKSALAGDVEWYRAVDYWDTLGWERMDELSNREGKNRDWNRTRFALELAQREPAIFLQRAPELLKQVNDEYRPEVEAKWRLVQADKGDADAKIEANNWVDEQKAIKKSIDAASVTQLLRVAAVAHQLNRADADDLSDYAAAIANQIKPTGDDAQNWGAILGPLGYAATARFVDGMKPIAEFKAWQSAMPNIAKTGDVAGSKAAIARMEELAATPEWVELARTHSWENPVSQIEYIRVEAARALADTDIPAALSLIADLGDTDYGRARASRTIADRAIKAGDFAVAQSQLRSAMKTNISNPEGFALAASLAQQVSPEFGAELWADALNKANPPRRDDDFGRGFEPSVAMWAFYHARLDAAQSRALIEREWNWRLPKATKAKDPNNEIDDGEQIAWSEALIMAMGAIDPARALEMRAQASHATGQLARANVGLAAVLLMNDAQRARWGVDSQF